MKRKIIYLVFLILLTFSSTAFATNWVHVVRSKWVITTDYYVDGDSVVKKGDTIVYWQLNVDDTPLPNGAVKLLSKMEAKQPLLSKSIELYWYDSNNKLVAGNPNVVGNFSGPYNANSPAGRVIDTAFKYAKEGKVTGQMPPLP